MYWLLKICSLTRGAENVYFRRSQLLGNELGTGCLQRVANLVQGPEQRQVDLQLVPLHKLSHRLGKLVLLRPLRDPVVLQENEGFLYLEKRNESRYIR